MWTTFIIVLIVLSILAAHGVADQPPNKKTVVESNHFFSEQQLQANYNVTSVTKGKPLILLLKKGSNVDVKSWEQNPITVKLQSGSDKIECVFIRYENLCVLSNIQDPLMRMTIGCKQLPCEASWIIYQPSIKVAKTQQKAEQLYEIPASQNHMIAIISCNDPQVKQLDESVVLYSDTPYIRAYTNSTIYFLFSNEKKGYMFIDIKQSVKNCAQLSLYNVPTSIAFDSSKMIRDFISDRSPAMFALGQSPKYDFRLKGNFHSLLKKKDIMSPVIVKLTALKDDKEVVICQQQIRTSNNSKKVLDFGYTFKKVSSQYEKLQFEFSSNGDTIVVNMALSQQAIQQVQLGDTDYFNLKKGEEISYKLLPSKDADDKSKAYLLSSNPARLKPSKQSCSLKEGCQFIVSAEDNADGYLTISSKADSLQGDVQFIPIKSKISRKIREGDKLYLKYKTKKNKSFQVVINSPNVIIYGSDSAKCRIPTMDCHERTSNIHHPFVYTPTSDSHFVMTIQGLDSSDFTLSILQADQNFVQLVDSQAFSYTMDSQQEQVVFKFKINKKQDVYFNLIAPVDTLDLLANNGHKLPDYNSLDVSLDGYLVFRKKNVDDLMFTIIVRKNENNKKKFAHFTLIASTAGSTFRLEPSSAHYQTIAPDKHRDFVFQFNPKDDYLVNFYIHNLKGQKINVQLLASNNNKFKDDPQKMIIDRESDVLNLKQISENLCASKGQNQCEIFLRMINTLDVEIDVTITLMVRNSVIELKDGIWQSYQENQIATSTNFYFYPKHADKNVIILYKSLFHGLRVVYNIWKTDSKSINPVEWPFPTQGNSIEMQSADFKPVKSITIGHDTLKEQCWPNCVILISFYRDPKLTKQITQKNLQYSYFRLVVSNNDIELPQKSRLDLSLKAQQLRNLIIDLKYVMDKQSLNFYVTSTIGSFRIAGNVYSERNKRCPIDGQSAVNDFQLSLMQTSIQLSSIKSVIKMNDMQDDKNLYLCLIVSAYDNSKLSIQYSCGKQQFKLVQMDSFETFNLTKDIQKYYKIAGDEQFYVKIIRVTGFPFVSIKRCDLDSQYLTCEKDFKQSTDKGKQLISKTQSFDETPCDKCFYLFKFSTQEPSSGNLHLQSIYTQMQLKEGVSVSDFTNQGQKNNYLITSVRSEDTIINIQITEGQINVTITDFTNINLSRSSSPDSPIIHIVIPSSDHKMKQLALGKSLMSSTSLSSTFNQLHMSIISKDASLASSFMISYSSGKQEVYLQDGLVADYVLESKKMSTFYYVNQLSSSHVYLALSTASSNVLTGFKIKTYYLSDVSDKKSRVQFTVQRPPMRKKTPNPTLLLLLPKQNFFVIEVTNQSPKDEIVSLGINHQQVILLPFNHEYPFTLHQGQQLNLLVDVNIVGYLRISIRKCDESEPTFGYTFDYNSFIKKDFSFNNLLEADPKFEFFVKANRIGTLYLNLKSDAEPSLLSVKVEFSSEKVKKDSIKPGNKGQIDYVLLDSSQAKMSFSSAVCSQQQCKNVKYYSISSTSMQNLYTQLVCPSSFFALAEATSIIPLPLEKIINNVDSQNKHSFIYTLLDHVSYVGVKAIAESGEQIYYRPIQVTTLWGQLSRTSSSHKYTMITIAIILLLGLLICVRKYSRKGYVPLNDSGND